MAAGEELPVFAHRGEIMSAMRSSPVVVVCGDTGSGKTTQLPKMALELGLGLKGRCVAVTQPRRMAAVAMAERVAEELGSETGGVVGYQHRYARKVSPATRVKFMTDGVLLAETRGDPLLRRYDAVIVDEAHERSLNIDFLLGILKRILGRRRDLKVVVSSATLDVERFSAFFGGAPVVRVQGRQHPVEIRYRPPQDGEDCDLAGEVAAAVAELPPRDDVLVFLPGERDIREAAERLAGSGRDDDVIPLMASLPAGEQRRAFMPSPRRRVILSTNVAETSVTIPGVRCVVDSGLARISRYIHRTKVQRLQIEPVSQASARQRAGRCGRIGPGTCIRLYSEEDFASREPFTPPELLRSSLAGVILTMLDLGLGDAADFPFMDPPRPAMLREGMTELAELGAVAIGADGQPTLTAVGRRLARIPVEPRLAKIMVAASDLATLPSALPVVAALACDDPRRRPVDEREKARERHAQWRVPGSDFLGVLKMWNWWLDSTKVVSQTAARKLCRQNYLSYPKMREWRELSRQLGELAARLGLDAKNDGGGPESLHRALLAGLLSRIGKFDTEERDYRGAHGVRFSLHPSSALAKKPPEWVVAGELVDTSRLFARTAAAIDVRWIEQAAGPLCRRSYRAPEWDAATGFVRATEQVSVYGLVVVPSRRCDYSRVDPRGARELFIRFGLVAGEFPHPPPQVRANSAMIGELRRRAEKTRRPDLFDEAGLDAFFEKAVPEGICSADALRKWLRRASPAELASFALRREDWFGGDGAAPDGFPDAVCVGGARLSLSYRHSPGDEEADGITCTARKSDAAALGLWRADWLVPGALPAKLAWMLSSLPSALRRVLAPVDEKVSVLVSKLKAGDETLEDAVRRAVYAEWGFRIPPGAWDGLVPPPHLRVRYRVKDDVSGKVLAASRDLGEVLRAVGAEGAHVAAEPANGGVKHVAWDFGPLDEIAAPGRRRSEMGVESYRALHDEGDGVSIRLYGSRAEAEAEHAAGLVRLFAIAMKGKARLPFRAKGLPLGAAMQLKEMGCPDERIAADVLDGAVREAMVRALPPVRDAEAFARRIAERGGDALRVHAEIAAVLRDSLVAAAEVAERLESGGVPEETAESVSTQLAWLVYPGFPRLVPVERLRRYGTYMKGIAVRLDRARFNPAGDRSKEARFAPYWRRYRDAIGAGRRVNAAALAECRWMLEEYRISLFAQELRTAEPVSPQRLDNLFASLQ